MYLFHMIEMFHFIPWLLVVSAPGPSSLYLSVRLCTTQNGSVARLWLCP